MKKQFIHIDGSRYLRDDEGAASYRVRHILGNRIWHLIHDRHLTEDQAAKLIGKRKSFVSKVLRGDVGRISLDRLSRIIHALGGELNIEIVLKGD